MADVVIPIEVAKSFCEGKTDHTVGGDNIRDLVKELCKLYPGIDAVSYTHLTLPTKA